MGGWCLQQGDRTTCRCCGADRLPPRCLVFRRRYGAGARPWDVLGSARPLFRWMSGSVRP
eukprot:15439380-Alexandrium_andersonii.AAC.2